MAARLMAEADNLGSAIVNGTLYWIDDYPGLVTSPAGTVSGDLLSLRDPASTLAWLDIYEECAPAFAPPHEFRHDMIDVDHVGRTVRAWTYIYARPVDGLPLIETGDFLTCAAPHRG